MDALDYPAIKTVGGEKVSRRSLAKDHPMYVDAGELSKLAPGKRFIQEEEEVALWPERFPLDELKRRQRLNTRLRLLYQQQPYIEGGNILKSEVVALLPRGPKPHKLPDCHHCGGHRFQKDGNSGLFRSNRGGSYHRGGHIHRRCPPWALDYPELRQKLININATWRGRGLRALYRG